MPVTLSLRGAALLLAPPREGGRLRKEKARTAKSLSPPPPEEAAAAAAAAAAVQRQRQQQGSGASRSLQQRPLHDAGSTYSAKAGVADSGDGEEEEEKEENSAAEAASPRKNPAGQEERRRGEEEAADAPPAPGEVTVLGTFEQGLRGGEDAKSVGTGAVVVGAYGNGRVILISPHNREHRRKSCRR